MSARGALDEAIVANERALAIAGDGAVERLARAPDSPAGAFRIGRRARAGARPAAGRGAASRSSAIGSTQLAFVHEALGERARAIELLEQALSEREPDLLWLAVDPRADTLRSEPRFEQVLERLGIPR